MEHIRDNGYNERQARAVQSIVEALRAKYPERPLIVDMPKSVIRVDLAPEPEPPVEWEAHIVEGVYHPLDAPFIVLGDVVLEHLAPDDTVF